MNARPFTTIGALVLIVFGSLIFLAGLGIGGIYILIGIPGLALVVGVVYDTIFKVPLKHLKAKIKTKA